MTGTVEFEIAPGPVLFARYAYPPNSLGYCGPGDPAALLGAATSSGGQATLQQLASRFEGAWPYLQLIAACNKIDDPLDRRVVEAYWVGNALLDHVPSMTLVSSLSDRFEERAGKHFSPIAGAVVPFGGTPHHSFHVFAVYPWLGLLRAGMDAEAPLTVLDRCRIRWGSVVSVEGDAVTVRSRPLQLSGHSLMLGGPVIEQVRKGIDGVGFVHGLAPGDVVSLHWDWVCDRLSDRALANLQAYTERNLSAVNALETPGPAVVLNRFG